MFSIQIRYRKSTDSKKVFLADFYIYPLEFIKKL